MSPAALRLTLVGVAGTSRDILLSVYALQAVVRADPNLSRSVDVETLHYWYVLPVDLDDRAAAIAGDVIASQPDVVGLSTYTWNFDVVARVAARIKEQAPDLPIIFGGPELAAGDVRGGRYDALPVDVVVVGEGETPLLKLLAGFRERAGQVPTGVPRTAWRTGDRFAWRELDDPSVDLVPDLADLPSPYLMGLVPDRLLTGGAAQVSIETQRGCNFRCAYCLYHANFASLRYRDPETVLEEIEHVSRHGVRHFRITDANFLSRKAHASHILEGLIHRGVRMSFFLEVIPSYLDADLADLLRRYREADEGNVVLAGIGLQTTNPTSLQAIRRRIPLSHFSRAYALLDAAGATVKTDVIVGLPHESRETFMATLDFVAEHMRTGHTYLSMAVLRILPGTELETIAGDAGLVVEPDSDHFVYETPTLPRALMVDCLRMSAMAVRVFHTLEDPDRIALRDAYFAVHDRTGVPHAKLLEKLSRDALEFLRGSGADYARDDFPRAEHFWSFEVHDLIPDCIVLESLGRVRKDRGQGADGTRP